MTATGRFGSARRRAIPLNWSRRQNLLTCALLCELEVVRAQTDDRSTAAVEDGHINQDTDGSSAYRRRLRRPLQRSVSNQQHESEKRYRQPS